MADVGRVVFRLGLRAQDHLVDELRHRQVLGAREDAIEGLGLQCIAPRQFDVEGLEEVAQRGGFSFEGASWMR